jgi:hypothetical protein
MFVGTFLFFTTALFYWMWRQNELFALSVRDGKILFARG